jgi:hypothetical protein
VLVLFGVPWWVVVDRVDRGFAEAASTDDQLVEVHFIWTASAINYLAFE